MKSTKSKRVEKRIVSAADQARAEIIVYFAGDRRSQRTRELGVTPGRKPTINLSPKLRET